MTIEREGRTGVPPEERKVKKVTRVVLILAVLAGSLTTISCGGSSLYTGVDSNGGWNAPVSRGTGTVGITGYPF
jgi:hypothetical protein